MKTKTAEDSRRTRNRRTRRCARPSGSKRLTGEVARAVRAALDKKAQDVVVLDLRHTPAFTDFFVLCSGPNPRQVKAIADAVEEALRAAKVRPAHVEGYDRAEWVLMDFFNFIVHVFTPQTREFYSLERLWGDAEADRSQRRAARRRKDQDRLGRIASHDNLGSCDTGRTLRVARSAVHSDLSAKRRVVSARPAWQPPCSPTVVAVCLVRAFVDSALSIALAPCCAACRQPLESPTRGAVCTTCWIRSSPSLRRSAASAATRSRPGALAPGDACARCRATRSPLRRAGRSVAYEARSARSSTR